MNLFPSKEQQRARWAMTRAKGRIRFVVINGALGWGLPTAVLYSVLMWFMQGSELRIMLPIALLFFPLGGLGWGWWVWRITEKEFVQHIDVAIS